MTLLTMPEVQHPESLAIGLGLMLLTALVLWSMRRKP